MFRFYNDIQESLLLGLLKKIKLKIKNNVKKLKKVLQNGYKYPQNDCKYTPDSTTLLFSIGLVLLSLSFLDFLFTFVFTKSSTKWFTKWFTKTFIYIIYIVYRMVYKDVFIFYIVYKLFFERFGCVYKIVLAVLCFTGKASVFIFVFVFDIGSGKTFVFVKYPQNGCKYTQDSTTLLFSTNFITLNLSFGGLFTKSFTRTFLFSSKHF